MEYKESVYLMEYSPGWGQHSPSGLDDLEIITPEEIYLLLAGQFEDGLRVSEEQIAAWWLDCINFKGRAKELPELEVAHEPECEHCGHDPMTCYILTYERTAK